MEELQPTSIRLTQELKTTLKRFVQEDRRFLSSYIVLVLERHVAEWGRKKAHRRNDPRRTSF